MRNILSYVPKKYSKNFRKAVKSIFRYTDIELARDAKTNLWINSAIINDTKKPMKFLCRI